MRKAYSILILILCFIISSYGQTKKISVDTIQQYFNETKVATNKYKKLWDFDLYGPMLIVNPFNRMVYANYPDNLGVLKKEGGLYVGTLPKGILLGNVATKWGGRTWAMVLTIFIKDEKEDRIELFTHELFHRVQPKLGFKKVNDGNNQHLDSKDGRIYLRLELKALVNALKASSPKETTKHVSNALKFRKYRYQLFPNAHASEATIEINEGIASYTGKVHRGLKGQDLSNFMEFKIQEFLKQPSYVQLFAYQTIPVYGFILSDKNRFWNKEVNSNTNLTDYLYQTFSFKSKDLSKINIESVGKQYDMDTIVSQETEREKKIQKQIAEYKQKFVEQPHFTIPFKKKRVAYDTRYITTIKGIGFVYPTFTARDVWGVLEVKKVGGLLNQKKTSVTITVPTSVKGRIIKGNGWTLKLNEGYELVKDENSGNFTLREN